MIDLVIRAAKSETFDHTKMVWESNTTALNNINPIYETTTKADMAMQVHFDPEIFPKWLFKMSAPNEDKEAFAYRKSIYCPYTVPSTGRALTATRRIWNPKNYSIDLDEEYLTSGYPGYTSLLNYFIQTFHPKKLEWANAVQVIRPRLIPTKETPEGEIVVDDSKPLEPIAIIIPSKNVIDFNEQFCLIKSETLVPIKQSTGEIHRTGRVYEYYDEVNIIRYVETSKPEANNDTPRFRTEPLFNEGGHGLGYVPCIKLKGRPYASVEGRIVYHSYFSPAIPMLNEALTDYSTLQMSKKAHGFPQKWEITDECGNNCTNGKVRVWDEDNKEKWEDCKACGGTGTNPVSVYKIKARDENGDPIQTQVPPVGWAAPDSDILEFNRKEINEAIEKAWLLLNLAVSNTEVKGNETALGKQIDREELFSFLSTLANELFEAFEFTANTIGKMRGDFDEVEIKPPMDFQIRSQEDLVEEVEKSGVPDIVKKDSVNELVEMRFASNEKAKRVNEVIQFSDKLFLRDSDEIRTMQLNIKPEFITLHLYILNYIEESLAKDEKFLDKDNIAIKKLLLDMALLDVKEQTFDSNFN